MTSPYVEVPEPAQPAMRRLINDNRRSLGLGPQCPRCAGDAGRNPHTCARTADPS